MRLLVGLILCIAVSAQKPTLGTVTDELHAASVERTEANLLAKQAIAAVQLQQQNAALRAKLALALTIQQEYERNKRLSVVEEKLKNADTEKERIALESKEVAKEATRISRENWIEVKTMGLGVIGTLFVAAILGGRKWVVDKRHHYNEEKELAHQTVTLVALQESNNKIQQSNDKIHALVNSQKTEMMRKVLISSKSNLAALEELVGMRLSRGEVPHNTSLLAIEAAKADVAGLERELATQVKTTEEINR